MKCAYSSNIGIRRKVNQDSYLAASFEKDGKVKYIFVVADGLGGHPAGEVASELAIDYIKQNVSAIDDFKDYDGMVAFVNAINQKIVTEGKKNPERKGMATTMTMGVVDQDSLVLAHVGDSRAYRISETGIEQLTKDHSLVQALVDEGRLQSDQARIHPQRNVITRALGTDFQVQSDLYQYHIDPGDIFLICSDGLYNLVPEAVIRQTVLNTDIENAVKTLIDMANANGGTDNITVILFCRDEKKQENFPFEKH